MWKPFVPASPSNIDAYNILSLNQTNRLMLMRCSIFAKFTRCPSGEISKSIKPIQVHSVQEFVQIKLINWDFVINIYACCLLSNTHTHTHIWWAIKINVDQGRVPCGWIKERTKNVWWIMVCALYCVVGYLSAFQLLHSTTASLVDFITYLNALINYLTITKQ